jgi:hypothetical protein
MSVSVCVCPCVYVCVCVCVCIYVPSYLACWPWNRPLNSCTGGDRPEGRQEEDDIAGTDHGRTLVCASGVTNDNDVIGGRAWCGL